MGHVFLKSPTNAYEVVKELGRTGRFNMYLCETPTRRYVLKIAASIPQNGFLDREAMILRDMRVEAARLEEEYSRVKDDPKKMLNYQLCFPDLVESFIVESQGGRRVNILDFTAVDDLGTLVPLRHLRTRDGVRVDRKTSAWIMGKLLKILVFAHHNNISVSEVSGRINGNNILIERKEHYVIIFDWTSATIHPEGIHKSVGCQEIAQVAYEVILALDGNLFSGEFPPDEHDPDGRYASHLYGLTCENENEYGAEKAHADFYGLVRSLWPREYWPFTTYPIREIREGR